MLRLYRALKAWFEESDQKILRKEKVVSLFFKSKYRKWIVVGLICLWQTAYYLFGIELSPDYRRADATGFNHYWGQHFVYFYHYKDLFPLATVDSTKEYSHEGATKSLINRPKDLRMEWGHWARFGESARIWLYMPHIWLTGDIEKPEIIIANTLILILALVSIWLSILNIGRPLLGIFLVLAMGFSPFILYETYHNNNIFGTLASISVILFSLHVSLFEKRKFRWSMLVIPVLSGIIVGFMHQVRAEILAMTLSPLVVYATSGTLMRWKKVVFSGVFLLTLFLSSKSIRSYFDVTLDKTIEIVEQVGGTPFLGGRTMVHPFWHPMYCGLGDYDKKYGLVLHDTAVYNFALPILRQQSGLKLKYPGKTPYEMDEFYDTRELYYKKVETIPGFEDIVRTRFLELVASDPGWYIVILSKRTIDFLFNLSPMGVSISEVVEVPYSGWISLLLLSSMLIAKQEFWVKYLLFTYPLGSSVILVYSAYNNSYQSIFHFFGFALVLYYLLYLLIDWCKSLKN